MPVDNEQNEGRMRELLSVQADRALASAPELNADDVIRRSRRRRAPRQAALGGVSALAVAGLLIVAVPAVMSTGIFGDNPTAVDSATMLSHPERSDGDAPETPDEAHGTLAALCHEQTPLDASSYKGLTVSLTAHAARVDATSWRIDAIVELANTDSRESRASGITGASFTLSQDGVPVAHGVWHRAEVPLEHEYLATGGAASHSISFVPVWCDGVPLSGEFELTVGVASSVYSADLVSEPVLVRIP